MRSRDTLFRGPDFTPADFRFDEAVAGVFPDMIHRSVPGYATLIHQIGVLAGRHATAGTTLYDLGCSLGAAALAMRNRLAGVACRVVAVDSSEAMIERARDYLAGPPPEAPPLLLRCADLREVEIRDASMVVLNLTLQFLPPEERLEVLRRCRRGIVEGGCLVLTEKVALEGEEGLLEELHLHFKRAQGYSELEVARKRAALERVLVPESLQTHQRRLEEAGFRRVVCWFRCYNFVSLLALP